jgi:hypothetical protein
MRISKPKNKNHAINLPISVKLNQKIKYYWRNDKGECPVPMLETHLKIMREYGRDMTRLGLSPSKLVRDANLLKLQTKELKINLFKESM